MADNKIIARSGIGLRRKAAWCQANSNWSQFAAERVNLRGTKLTSLRKSGGAVELEIGPAVDAAFLVEVVEDGDVNGGEFSARLLSQPPISCFEALPKPARQSAQ